MTPPASKNPVSNEAATQDAALELDRALHAVLKKFSMGLSPIALSLAYMDWVMHLGTSPGRQMLLVQKFLADGQQALQGPAEEKDARFAHASWQQWPFNTMRAIYKMQADHWSRSARVEGMSDHHAHMVQFFTRQWLDSMAPSNWPLSNPEVLTKARDTLGQSLHTGWQQYLEDMYATLSAAKTDAEAAQTLSPLPFAVGRDVAVTPGKVVYRNHLIELIQYAPATEKVYAEPVLIVPSCIMKYYILDLSPGNSMVRYLVEQGHTVFMISWRNPDASDRDLGMDDYLRMGLLDAMAAVKSQTGESRLHGVGYCLGGTFLSIVASVLGRNAKTRKGGPGAAGLPELASVTLLAAQTDFSEPGELGLLIDADQLQSLREEMAQKGYLSGRQMADSFKFLNARDLIWSRNTHRYLLGEQEVGVDMLSWNADLTRLPERMHNEYLGSLFLHNALAQGHFRFEGKSLALRDIRSPMLVVGTVRDHVSPWRSVYKIHLTTDVETTFILTSGGHNAGIVSEPGHPHRSYQMDQAPAGSSWVEPEDWVERAPRYEGSWWPSMQGWLASHSGRMVKARKIAAATALCDAPGEYVMVRYAD